MQNRLNFRGRQPSWERDSIGWWQDGTLVVETNNFQYIWLNDAGAPHRDMLRLTERYKLNESGRFLQVKMTTADPHTWDKPYTYVRYYKKTNSEIHEDLCWDDLATVKP